ncbi:hypothetical protein PO124_01500 [Bacillus licheniformis]|nr:hypothetical protein [Bacillus licheniformis]
MKRIRSWKRRLYDELVRFGDPVSWLFVCVGLRLYGCFQKAFEDAEAKKFNTKNASA